MSKRTLGLMLAGSLLAAAGCVGNPAGNLASNTTLQKPGDTLLQQTTPLSTSGTLDLGLAGSGYAIAAVADGTGGQGGQVTYTYGEVMFRPELVELHYAGPLTEAEEAAEPQDVKGAESAQAQPTDSTTQSTDASASTIPADGWIKFPVNSDFAAFDLMKLGANPVSFGNSPLPAGKYDQIRLSAQSTESKALLTFKATGSDSNAYSGNYFLPSGRLYITQGFEVRDGYKTDLKFAFTVQEAMVKAGDQVILKPSSVKVYADYVKIEPASPSPTPTPEATSSAS